MHKFFFIFLYLGLTAVYASQEETKNILFKLETEFSTSQEAKVSADLNVWDPAVQGYNSKLKHAWILGGGFEYILTPWISTDLSFFYRDGYKYRKSQTPAVAVGGVYYGDSKFRLFNLAISSLMLSLNIKGNGLRGWHYQDEEQGSLYPVISAGIGGSYHKVTNLYTIRDHNAASAPIKRASSIGADTKTTSLSYHLGLGIEYQKDTWFFSIGYRWFDPGQFKCPSYLIDNLLGSNSGIVVPPWKVRFQAHEFTLSVKKLVF